MASSTRAASRATRTHPAGASAAARPDTPDRVETDRGHKHGRVYAALLDLLAHLPSGAEVPSERQLCIAHGVSRPTVRRALMQLESEGRIRSHRGRRRVTTMAKLELPLSLTSLSADLRAQGIVPGTKLINVSRLDPGAEEVARRALGTNREILRVERLRLADGQPVAIETLFVTADRFDDISASLGLGQSFYALVNRTYGIELGSAEETIEAVGADPREAALLAIPPRTPVLLLSRRTVDVTGSPIEYVRSLYRADRFRLVAHLVPTSAASPMAHALRVATVADAPALADVFIAAWRSAYPEVLDPDVLEMWQPAATEEWMRDLVATPGEATVATLSADGGVSGFIRYGPDPDDLLRGQIYSVYVHPSQKRRGVGATLVKHAVEELSALGFRDISLWVFEANIPARGLYSSLGFEPNGKGRVEPEFRAPEIMMVRRGDRLAPVGEEQQSDGR